MQKNFLDYENHRNQQNHDLFKHMLQRAFKCDEALIAHHLVYTRQEDDVPIEIPSADTLMFDHDIMRAIFGESFQMVVANLARTPVPQRDELLAHYFKEMVDGT